MIATVCVRCGARAGSFIEIEPDEWACLNHFSRREVRAHLSLVPEEPTPLEELLLASLTQRSVADAVNALVPDCGAS